MDLISTFENNSNETNYFVYRTEVYLQQREQDSIDRTSPGTITTWENLKNQKQIFDDDQAEIDRVLSTIDSIHGTFNRSLLIPYNQVYSSLYGDDENDDSVDLMKMFCQRRDHCSHFDDESKTRKREKKISKLNFLFYQI